MFILPIIITFMVLLIIILFTATDYRVYSRGLRLDLLEPFAVISLVASGIISLVLYVGVLR